MHTLQVKRCGLFRVIKHKLTSIWVVAVSFMMSFMGYDVVLNWSELWHERNSEKGFCILSLPLVLQLGQCHNKKSRTSFSFHRILNGEKESAPQWRIMSKFAAFFTYMYIYKNYIDCTARNIGVKDQELKIVLKL